MDTNRISKSDFLKLDEKDLMFITNPGRMGDEDGSTFIIKDGNSFTIYRVDGWMYGKDPEISLDDARKQFPEWSNTWKEGESSKGKYKYLYMGFGNGLCVDRSIYDEYEPYLNSIVEEHLEGKTKEDKENLKYAEVFNAWEIAFTNMIKDKQYVLKKVNKID